MSVDIGVLGLSSFYTSAYARRAADHRDCSVVGAGRVAVGDAGLDRLDRLTADEFATEFDCPVYETADPVLSAADAVVVATPTTRRASDAVRALERDTHVLLAKPAAGRYEPVREVARAAQDTDAVVGFTLPARHDDAVAELGRRVAAGAVGDVHAVRASIRHDRVPTAGAELNPEHAPDQAGATHAMAVYIADMLLWLSEGSPVRAVAAYTNRATPHVEHPDLGSMIVRFDDDTVGTATLTTSTDCREPWGNWEVEVVGDGGVLRTAHNGYEGIQWSAGDVDERTATAFGRTTSPVLDRALGMFVDSVLGRSEPTPSADEVVAAHVLCDIWARSADQCRLVRVDDRSAWE